MKEKIKIMFLGMVLVLSGCTAQTVAKKPPLIPYNQAHWVEINQQDFVPPQAKMYAKVAEVYIEPTPQEVGE